MVAKQTHPHTFTCTPQIWDKSTLQLLKVLEGHKSVVRCLQFDRKVVISGSYDYTVKLVHLPSLSACCTSLIIVYIDAELDHVQLIGVHVDSYPGLPELQACVLHAVQCGSYHFWFR